MRSALKTLMLAAALGAGLSLAPAALAQAGGKPAANAKADEKIDLKTAPKRDLIIFRSGNKVEGIVLSETPTEVRFLLIIGSLRSETSYPKSDILEIKRDEFKPEVKAEDKAEKNDAKAADKPGAKGDEAADADGAGGQLVDVNNKPVAPGATTVYVVNVPGNFAREVSNTPLRRIMDDIVRVQPSIVVFRFDYAPTRDGAGRPVDFIHGGYEGAFDQMDAAQQMMITIHDRIRDDPALKTRPRMVAWINRALGAGAFLPFSFPEIYFTSGGHHGGIGGLDLAFAGVGDLVAQRKQQSLRLARARGFAEFGGQSPEEDELRSTILRGMAWADLALSYKIEGGKAKFFERMPESPDEILLKDRGMIQESQADTLADTVRLRGNDLLTLDARTAFDIGFSKGTADTIDELIFKLGVTRDYAILKTRSPNLIKSWTKELTDAEQSIRGLIEQFQRVEVRPPGGYRERTAARGQQLRLLRQIEPLVERYKEAIDLGRLGAPDGLKEGVRIAINRIETQQRLDRPDQP
jgi:hypothetical protein